MGFTRYWDLKKKPTKKERDSLHEAMSTIVKVTKKDLTGWDGEKGTEIELKRNCVSFNGIEDDSHETFSFIFGVPGGGFCKTARKPYDGAVAACLHAAKRILGAKLVVDSDGPGEYDDLAVQLVDYVLEGKKPEDLVIEVRPVLKLVKGGKE